MNELTERRTERSKTYLRGKRKYRLVSHTGAIHYKDDYSNSREQWKDIDLTIVDGKITKAPYDLTITDEISLKCKKTGDGVTLKPSRLGTRRASIADYSIKPYRYGVRLQRQIESARDPHFAEYDIDIKGKSIRIKASARDLDGKRLHVDYRIEGGKLIERLPYSEDYKYPITIDPDLSVPSSTSDGYITMYGGYWEIHEADEGVVVDDEITAITGQEAPWGALIYRGFLFFDTSALSEDDTIDDAVIRLYIDAIYVDNAFSIVVQDGQPDYPHDPLEEGDYNKDHYSGDGGSQTSANLAAGAYRTITLNTDGKGWINKEGTTKLCLRSDRDIDAEMPSLYDSEYAVWRTAESDDEPYIEIDYTEIVFPAECPGLRVAIGGETIQLCLVDAGEGAADMGGVPRIRKGGQTYDVYLVETDDEYASPVRIKTTDGIKAIRKSTYEDIPHEDIHEDIPHEDIPAYSDHTDYPAHDQHWDEHDDTPYDEWHSDTPWGEWDDWWHPDLYVDSPPHSQHIDEPHTDDHTDWHMDHPWWDSHKDTPHTDDPHTDDHTDEFL